MKLNNIIVEMQFFITLLVMVLFFRQVERHTSTKLAIDTLLVNISKCAQENEQPDVVLQRKVT